MNKEMRNKNVHSESIFEVEEDDEVGNLNYNSQSIHDKKKEKIVKNSLFPWDEEDLQKMKKNKLNTDVKTYFEYFDRENFCKSIYI
jgi:hypothetical protein